MLDPKRLTLMCVRCRYLVLTKALNETREVGERGLQSCSVIFGGFFRELSDLVAAGPPSPHARLEIAERYGLEFAEPSWLPDIIERYNLTPPPR